MTRSIGILVFPRSNRTRNKHVRLGEDGNEAHTIHGNAPAPSTVQCVVHVECGLEIKLYLLAPRALTCIEMDWDAAQPPSRRRNCFGVDVGSASKFSLFHHKLGCVQPGSQALSRSLGAQLGGS
jgi:hypothetical protein